MEKMNFDKANSTDLEMKFSKACEDKTFSLISKKLDLPVSTLMKNTSRIKDCAKELDNCKNCKGLEFCQNEVKGNMLKASKSGSGIEFSYVECKYKEKEKYKDNISLFDLPLSLKNASIKDVKLDGNRKEVIKEIQTFYKDYLDGKNPKGIYLVGNFGTGKSYIIAALLNSLAKDGVKSVIVHTSELIRGLKASFDTDYNERMELVMNAPILLLDDIGSENLTAWSRDDVIEPLLQYRMDNNKTTFFTSNFDFDGLEKHFTINGEGVKAERIINRVKALSKEVKLICKNYRD